jgi:hypothetical protein
MIITTTKPITSLSTSRAHVNTFGFLSRRCPTIQLKPRFSIDIHKSFFKHENIVKKNRVSNSSWTSNRQGDITIYHSGIELTRVIERKVEGGE